MAQTIAITGCRVLNKKAVATNTSMAVQTIPRRGNANMVRPMMTASAKSRIQDAWSELSFIFSAGSLSTVRQPTSNKPIAIRPVSAVRT